jgi:lipopolysaccharide cholinephosphotransferase
MDFDIIEYKKKIVNILKGFHEFCVDNKLRYSISYGSLLGAIRHKGIIPWDDDIDVVMPRPDYEKFIRLTLNNYLRDHEVISIYNHKDYYLPFAKVIDKNTSIVEYKYCDFKIGAFIDVFPVDGLPNDTGTRKKTIDTYNKYLKISLWKTFNYTFSDVGKFISGKGYIISMFFKLFCKNKNYLLKCEEIAKTFDFEESDEVMVFSSIYGEREIINKDYFNSYILVDFENIKVSCISAYHDYLTRLYGDYWVLPPIEKRKTHHSHHFVDLSRGYNENEIKSVLVKIKNGQFS